MTRSALVLFLASTGCTETCPTPNDVLDGREWQAFLKIVGFDQQAAPEYPAATSPMNGPHVYAFAWASASLQSPAVVTVDGQVFEGEGTFDENDCGNFVVGWQGSYLGEDGSQHHLGVAMDLVQWETNLDGFVRFESSWESAGGMVGDAAGDAQFTATGP